MRLLTFGELVEMATPPSEVLAAYRNYVDSGYVTEEAYASVARRYGVTEKHPYFISFCVAAKLGLIDSENSQKLSYKTKVTGDIFARFMHTLAPEYEFTTTPGKLLRKHAFVHLRRALLK